MAVPVVLGVDVGTSSTKGVLVTGDGAVLRSTVREHAVSRPYPGHVELDARLWWQEFVDISRELLAPADAVVRAGGVRGMGPCVLLAAERAEPATPAIASGCATRH